MADVRPLRGVRFNPRLSGPVGPLIAPPYDVTSEFTDGAEFSVRNIESVHLGGQGDDHALAAKRYLTWLHSGALRQDNEPTLYLHRHQFNCNGVVSLRTGLFARVRLADWSERIVLPHEGTTPGPRKERLERLRAVNANLSPLYFLFRDPEDHVAVLIAEHANVGQSLDLHDRMGGKHSLTFITNTAVHAQLAEAFAHRTLFVADGHHRYEAALSFRNECRNAHGYAQDAPWEFVFALLAAVEDPGVIVRPTHRVLIGDSSAEPGSLLTLLRRWFDLHATTLDVPMPSDRVVSRIVLPGEDGVWDIHSKPRNPHFSLLPRDRGAAWRSLGIAAVGAIAESLNGVGPQASYEGFIPVVDELMAVEMVKNGGAQAAFLLPAPKLGRLLSVAEEGDLLPAKSTWFEPKAPAGLVINDLSV